jgi:hypothetical protein
MEDKQNEIKYRKEKLQKLLSILLQAPPEHINPSVFPLIQTVIDEKDYSIRLQKFLELRHSAIAEQLLSPFASMTFNAVIEILGFIVDLERIANEESNQTHSASV